MSRDLGLRCLKSVRKIEFRVLLPIVFGFVAIGLMAGDWYVRGRCMGYDAGRPFWPCDVARYVLVWLNAPAIAIAHPLAWIGRLGVAPMRYLVEFPFILGWWWFVGTRFDFSLLGVGRKRYPRLYIAVLGVFSLLLLAWIGDLVRDYVRSHHYMAEHGFTSNLVVFLRVFAFAIWPTFLLAISCIAIIRLMRVGSGSEGQLIRKKPLLRVGVFCVAYTAAAVGIYWFIPFEAARRAADIERRSATVHGRVVDEKGLPAYGVEVELVPVSRSPDEQWKQMANSWTDKNGEYSLKTMNFGPHFLAVRWNASPGYDSAFSDRYYPAVEDGRDAERLVILESLHLELQTMQLHSIPFEKVSVLVRWEEGTPEPSAYLYLKNLSYPEFRGWIDHLRPQKDGTVALPKGFEYQVYGMVECDVGNRLEEQQTPSAMFTTRSKTGMVELVIPGKRCTPWTGWHAR